MRGGHNAKPISEKKQSGTYRPSRDAGRMSDIDKKKNYPTCPSYFDNRHREKWNEVISLTKASGVCDEIDADSLALYVQSYWAMIDAYLDFNENGLTLWVDTGKGGKKPMTNPAYSQWLSASKVVQQVGDKFGFSPRARMGIKVSPVDETPKDGDDLY